MQAGVQPRDRGGAGSAVPAGSPGFTGAAASAGAITGFVVLCLAAFIAALLAVPAVRMGGEHLVRGTLVLEIGPDPGEAAIARAVAWGLFGFAVLVGIGATVVAARRLHPWTIPVPLVLVAAGIAVGFAVNQVPIETCHLYFPDCGGS